MGTPSHGWQTLHKDSESEALKGGGFSVRGRLQDRADELWLNVELPEGSWSYLVLRDGRVVVNVQARTKKEAWTAAAEQLKTG